MAGVDEQESASRGRPAKVGHRKSRNGCLKCKTRRVKCDEIQPVCGNCSRLCLDCAWPSEPHDLRSRHTDRDLRTSRRKPQSTLLDPATNTRSGTSPSPMPSPQPSPSTFSGSGPCAQQSESPDQGASAFIAHWPSWAKDDKPFAHIDTTQEISLPETKARRMLEHRLFQNWYVNFNNSPVAVNPSQTWRYTWATQIPVLALQHENLLHGLLATSATNLLRTEPGNAELYTARQAYFISALQAQRHELEQLSIANAESVSLCSLLISVTSFAMIKERSLDPYEPPLEWLHLGRGAGSVIWQGVKTIIAQSKESENKAIMAIAGSYPRLSEGHKINLPEMRIHFANVLTQHIPSDDDWTDDDTRDAYEKTLSYIGLLYKGIEIGEPNYELLRKVQAFALFIPPKFVELLRLQRPRALVVLAHFWSAVSLIRGAWWLGEDDARGNESTATREIRGIMTVLPSEWHAAMMRPLDQIGLRHLCVGI
ncbi:hypothetical protein BD289DRAFT_260942 [Coniella lustricola]|uniref:Zn(2)-C6 fungal-type domain-containing protein n=1 Tax=Coniella lustricola TaxID=2025994 RepID=A0A2T3A7Q9_9PEZI|nr:hypothetical protein BD289DRAFT_260942 [Coniella lustricola]